MGIGGIPRPAVIACTPGRSPVDLRFTYGWPGTYWLRRLLLAPCDPSMRFFVSSGPIYVGIVNVGLSRWQIDYDHRSLRSKHILGIFPRNHLRWTGTYQVLGTRPLNAINHQL